MADVAILDIRLYGTSIGTLTRVGGDRTLFAFDDAYIADESRPVLGLGFKDEYGNLITGFAPTRMRVMPFFANLLPEGPLRTYLAVRAGVRPGREFFLLWVLGRDLPGAITIEPADGEAWPAATTADDGDSGGDRRATALRFSLAGVQLKFSAVAAARGGLTIPAGGVGGSWIVKLPSQTFAGVPENEFSMMSLARSVGIDVPPIRLVDIADIDNLPDGIGPTSGQAFAIARFDRSADGAAVHIEDFAQVFGVYPEHKYERASARNIAAVIGAEGSAADIAEFVRRLTFNALIGNADMHLKNWSLIYPDRRHAALAPAYDFVSTIAYIPDRNAALKVSRTRRFREFTEDELSHLAAKAHLPQRLVVDIARETVARFHEAWDNEKAHLPLRAEVVEAIEAQLRIVPIARPGG